jgi:UDPglucose 6-dehydrogenase
LEEHSALKCGRDFGLCVQPEFLRAASSEEDFLKPSATVIGELDKRAGDILESIYSDFGSSIIRVSPEVAEFSKYINNCFNAVKISFSNEIWLLGKELDIDANLALQISSLTAEAYKNPKYGLLGGLPFGGACLPKDADGLLRFTKQMNVDMPLLSAVVAVNSKMNDLAKRGIIPHSIPHAPQLANFVLKKLRPVCH